MTEKNQQQQGKGSGGGALKVCIYCGQEFSGFECPNVNISEHKEPKFRRCGVCKNIVSDNGQCRFCDRQKQDRIEEKRCEHELSLAGKKQEIELYKEREAVRMQAEMRRTTNFVSCKSCGLEFSVVDVFCKHCFKECTESTCKHHYNKDLLECPKCTLPRKYDLRVDVDRDDINSRWELKLFLFKQVGSGKAKAMNGTAEAIKVTVSLNDPLETSVNLTLRPDGAPLLPDGNTIKYLKYSEKRREVSFSVIDSADGSVNIEPKKIPLEGKTCKFHETTSEETNSWLQDFIRALKGE